MFWIAFVVFNVTNVVYVIWASGEIQPWNNGALVNTTDDFERSSNSDDPTKSKIEELKSGALK